MSETAKRRKSSRGHESGRSYSSTTRHELKDVVVKSKDDIQKRLTAIRSVVTDMRRINGADPPDTAELDPSEYVDERNWVFLDRVSVEVNRLSNEYADIASKVDTARYMTSSQFRNILDDADKDSPDDRHRVELEKRKRIVIMNIDAMRAYFIRILKHRDVPARIQITANESLDAACHMHRLIREIESGEFAPKAAEVRSTLEQMRREMDPRINSWKPELKSELDRLFFFWSGIEASYETNIVDKLTV